MGLLLPQNQLEGRLRHHQGEDGQRQGRVAHEVGGCICQLSKSADGCQLLKAAAFLRQLLWPGRSSYDSAVIETLFCYRVLLLA